MHHNFMQIYFLLSTFYLPLLGEAWLMHHNFMQIEGVANLHLLPPTGALLSIGFAKVRYRPPQTWGSILGRVTVFRTDIYTHSLTHSHSGAHHSGPSASR